MWLLIHGVNPWGSTFLSTPDPSILSISALRAGWQCTGSGLCGTCFGGALGSSLIWYGSPGNLPIPVNTFGNHSLSISFKVICLGSVPFVVTAFTVFSRALCRSALLEFCIWLFRVLCRSTLLEHVSLSVELFLPEHFPAGLFPKECFPVELFPLECSFVPEQMFCTTTLYWEQFIRGLV